MRIDPRNLIGLALVAGFFACSGSREFEQLEAETGEPDCEADYLECRDRVELEQLDCRLECQPTAGCEHESCNELCFAVATLDRAVSCDARRAECLEDPANVEWFTGWGACMYARHAWVSECMGQCGADWRDCDGADEPREAFAVCVGVL